MTVQDASAGDSATLPETLTMAATQVEAVQPDGDGVEEVVADKVPQRQDAGGTRRNWDSQLRVGTGPGSSRTFLAATHPHPPQTSRFELVGEGPLDQLPASPLKTTTGGATNTATVPIHKRTGKTPQFANCSDV